MGVFLSGGIDSSAVLALSRVIGQEDIRTFSISFDDPLFNEGDVSARTAKCFGARHSDWRLDAVTGRGLFHEYMDRLDQPSIDGFNTFTISKFAHDRGMKVVLSGLGGDELFGGYPSFRRVPQLANIGRMLGPLRTTTGKMLCATRKPQWRRLGSFLQRTPTLPAAYGAYRGVFSLDEAQSLAVHFTGAEIESNVELLATDQSQPTPDDEVSELEITRYMRNQLLRDSDVMSMSWGLELRVPLVDQVLFDAVSRIPAKLRLRAGKKMLLEAVPEVPEWVWNRPKRGFLFPYEKWIAGDWGEMFRTSQVNGAVPLQTWYQKWSVFVLRRWCARHGVPLAADG